MNKRKFFFILVITSAIVLSATFTVVSFKNEIKKSPLPVLGVVDPFELINSYDEPFSSKALEGKVWISNFIFTTCSDICPVMSKNMAALNRSFEKVKGVSLVSITVNPEFDTPAVLRKYAESYDAVRDNWFFF